MKKSLLTLVLLIATNASAEIAVDMGDQSEPSAPAAVEAPKEVLPKCGSGKFTAVANPANKKALGDVLGVSLNKSFYNSAKQQTFDLTNKAGVFIVNVSEYAGYDIRADICQLGPNAVRARLVYGGSVRGYVDVKNAGKETLRISQVDEKGRAIIEGGTPNTGIFRATAAR